MNAKQFAFMITVAIIFAVLIGLAIDAFYTEPKYETYCNDSQYGGRYTYPAKPYPEVPQINCTMNYTLRQDIEFACSNSTQYKGFVRYKYDAKGCEILESAFCDTCNVEYDKARNIYNRNVFYIAFVIGVIAIIFGIATAEVLGAGFMFGGVLLAFYGVVRYFSDLGKIMRVVVVFIAFVLLVYFGRKRLEGKSSHASEEKQQHAAKK